MEVALGEYLVHAPVFVRTLPGEIIFWPEGAQEMYGHTSQEAVGSTSHELLKTAFPSPLEDINSVLLETGKWEGLLRHRRKDGSTIWVESRWRLRGGERGDKVVEINTDVTQREMLARELAHRIKNIVSTVQGLARFSLQGNPERGLAIFEERLKALADANDVLVRHSWSRGYLREVLDSTSKRFRVEDRFHRSGPRIPLPPGSVISYSLAFHELATNALKYGALSVPDGRVDVSWSLPSDKPGHISLIWRESGGPPVRPPERRGFGVHLIERAVASELGTPVQLRFEASGLVCEFDGDIEKESEFSDEW